MDKYIFIPQKHKKIKIKKPASKDAGFVTTSGF
jgi:hypothetical protein